MRPRTGHLFDALPGLAALLVLTLLVAGCEPSSRVMDPLDDVAVSLVDADSNLVVFPRDFEGAPTLVGFVYTHCPDICPMTTSNMRQVWRALGEPDDVQFVTLTFDPVRDTPATLRAYRDAYGLQDANWHFLTGEPDTVAALMDRLGIRTAIADTTTTPEGETIYFIDHTDQISLLDAQGRLVFEYGGSMTPPEILVEDVNALRAAP